MFLHASPYLGNFVSLPFLSRLFVDFVVLTLRLLVRQAGIAKPTPNRILREFDRELVDNDLTQSAHRPQIRFIPEVDRSLEHQTSIVFKVAIIGTNAPFVDEPQPFSAGFDKVAVVR